MPTRRFSPLRRTLEDNLLAYAAAATAAGIGLTTLAPPANAEVVFTRTNQPIPVDSTLPLDLDNDGRFDFTLSNFVTDFAANGGIVDNPQTGGREAYLAVEGRLPANRVVMNHSYMAAAMKPQQVVGPGDLFFRKKIANQKMEFCGLNNDTSTGPVYRGSWKNVQHRYLGVEFKIDKKIHYGWARFQVSVNGCTLTETLTGYAYETVPKKPIVTGDKGKANAGVKPAGLGNLALGAAAGR
jgi:hypothetical protein